MTTEDLEQIRKLLEAERTETGKLIDQKLEPIHKQLQAQGKDIKAIDRKVDLIGKRFNKDDVEIIKRVERIEHHVGIAPMH
jgi:hypothetical protein